MNTTRPIEIQVYGLFRSLISISNVARQYAHALIEHYDNVGLFSYSVDHPSWNAHPPRRYSKSAPTTTSFFAETLSDFAGHNPQARIGIFCGSPEEAGRYLALHEVKIGLFVCETDRIPTLWVDICNTLDLVVVPSEFCQRTYLESGVRRRLIVVPHALEPEYVPVDVVRPSRFTFYNTFNSLSSPERKSCEELVRSFLRAFAPGDDVCLRLRTQLSPELTRCREKYDFGDLIVVDPLVFTDTASFARIYSEVHCTVHPSKGEGFGLVPLQSIACGTPVIAPFRTGMADYLRDDNAIELRTRGMVHGDSWGNQPGNYYSIDEDDLAERLRHVRKHWDEELAKVRKAGPQVREAYSPGRVFAPFLNVLASYL